MCVEEDQFGEPTQSHQVHFSLTVSSRPQLGLSLVWIETLKDEEEEGSDASNDSTMRTPAASHSYAEAL